MSCTLTGDDKNPYSFPVDTDGGLPAPSFVHSTSSRDRCDVGIYIQSFIFATRKRARMLLENIYEHEKKKI